MTAEVTDTVRKLDTAPLMVLDQHNFSHKIFPLHACSLLRRTSCLVRMTQALVDMWGVPNFPPKFTLRL
jgi:hypothetical protein